MNANDIPNSYKNLYQKAMAGRSQASAVKCFCLQCVCWQKEEIRHCTSKGCPLYPYRPYKTQNESADRASKIAERRKIDPDYLMPSGQALKSLKAYKNQP
ncbi:MAG: hypothetical protein K9M57_08905 [Phycisphaerae bacterium]|nr:hypothetical protein [Phycisphaerae bacterium]